MEELKYKYLYDVNYPDDLKKINRDELHIYCSELRNFIINELASNPGHLGASLGVVELAVALHYVFNTPDDKLIWDVGHQAYAHKIITGRRDKFHTNRKLGGISGFPNIKESKYDAFGTGHSSTSISAALGIAMADKLTGKNNKVIAVIGDGALSGGLAFEGLNNAGIEKTDLLVILNDNHISIDPNVGALKEYLLSMSTSKRYNKLKANLWDMLSSAPKMRNIIKKIGNTIKLGLLQQGNLFESLHFRYFGPIDGHDVKQLTKVLKDLKDIPGPKLLHVLTVKGKGYIPAEKNQSLWHAPGKFNPETGEIISSTDKNLPPKYQDVFGETILELALQNDKIVGVTPAMPTGCSLNIMMEKLPERTFDVGIAEGHAVTFSAGMAINGMIPFCNIYSSFMQRAYDNIIHDAALQNLDVILCLDRAGIVGEDGATHHGVFDIAYLRCIPNVTIAAPMNEIELRNIMYTASKGGCGTFAIRYPRGNGVFTDWKKDFNKIEIGKANLIKDGNDIAVISLGHVGNFVTEAINKAEKEGLSVAHIDLRFAKPLDKELIMWCGKKFSKIITVEDGILNGGIGSAIIELLNDNQLKPKVIRLGINDKFIEHGKPSQLYKICGYDADAIYTQITKI